MKVLVSGATGYIGGRLIPRLLAAGHQVRVLVRDTARIQGRPWSREVEPCRGDVMDLSSLQEAAREMDAAYYLVHSMQSGVADFAAMDRRAAQQFAAATSHLRHVVYLGGLLPSSRTSDHLRSRAEVGEILRSQVAATEFRAGPIVGSGSASFELVRYIAERFPVLLAPRGIGNAVQPVAVSDVLQYLVLALDRGPQGVVEVGAADQVSFGSMMQIYAEVRHLHRRVLETPLLSPRLCAHIAGLLTPIPNSLASPLLEGIGSAVVADTARARAVFPEVRPMSYREAVERALQRIAERTVETHWSGALGVRRMTVERTDWEGLYRERRAIFVEAPPAAVFRSFCSLGGDRGWVAWNFAWKVRGLIDELIGGPGLRRGRRHPTELLAGEALDVWRVEAVEPPSLLRLRAEMKVPGEAWLQFEAVPERRGTQLVITALMEPHGLPGWLYWWSTYPFHRFGFQQLALALARQAEAMV